MNGSHYLGLKIYLIKPRYSLKWRDSFPYVFSNRNGLELISHFHVVCKNNVDEILLNSSSWKQLLIYECLKD